MCHDNMLWDKLRWAPKSPDEKSVDRTNCNCTQKMGKMCFDGRSNVCFTKNVFYVDKYFSYDGASLRLTRLFLLSSRPPWWCRWGPRPHWQIWRRPFRRWPCWQQPMAANCKGPRPAASASLVGSHIPSCPARRLTCDLRWHHIRLKKIYSRSMLVLYSSLLVVHTLSSTKHC